MIVAINTTVPEIIITPNKSTSTSTPSFNINIHKLREVNGNGVDVAIVDLTTYKFALVQTLSSPTNLTWEYSAVLDNGAVINATVSLIPREKGRNKSSETERRGKFFDSLYFIQFTKDSLFTFAGASTTYSANSLKLNLNLSNWPFKSIFNTLKIEMETAVVTQNDTSSDACHNGPVTSYDSDSGNSLQWIKINQNGVAVYLLILFSFLSSSAS